MNGKLSEAEIAELSEDTHLQAYAVALRIGWKKFGAMDEDARKKALAQMLKERGRALDDERWEWERSWAAAGVPN